MDEKTAEFEQPSYRQLTIRDLEMEAGVIRRHGAPTEKSEAERKSLNGAAALTAFLCSELGVFAANDLKYGLCVDVVAWLEELRENGKDEAKHIREELINNATSEFLRDEARNARPDPEIEILMRPGAKEKTRRKLSTIASWRLAIIRMVRHIIENNALEDGAKRSLQDKKEELSLAAPSTESQTRMGPREMEQIRESLGLTQAQMAEKLFLQRDTYREFATGKYCIAPSMAATAKSLLAEHESAKKALTETAQADAPTKILAVKALRELAQTVPLREYEAPGSTKTFSDSYMGSLQTELDRQWRERLAEQLKMDVADEASVEVSPVPPNEFVISPVLSSEFVVPVMPTPHDAEDISVKIEHVSAEVLFSKDSPLTTVSPEERERSKPSIDRGNRRFPLSTREKAAIIEKYLSSLRDEMNSVEFPQNVVALVSASGFTLLNKTTNEQTKLPDLVADVYRFLEKLRAKHVSVVDLDN